MCIQKRLNILFKRLEELTRAKPEGHVRKNSSTGVTGVSVNKSGTYQATLIYNKKSYHFGSYDNLYDAAFARYSAELKNAFLIKNPNTAAKRFVSNALGRGGH